MIAPHAGPTNARLRVHLPLVLPPSGGSCGIRVGGVDRIYEEGKCVVFDDSYLHETWNDGEGERVLLLFDVWHPDVRGAEREGIREMFRYAKEQKWLK